MPLTMSSGGLAVGLLVGTDRVQAVPLLLAAALSNVMLHGLDWSILIPLVIGSVPGTMLGSTLAPKVPQSVIRRGIVVVLSVSAVALLGKAGWSPLLNSAGEFNPLIALYVGLGMLVVVPLLWGLIRKSEGLPMFGAPYIRQIDSD